MLADTRRSSWRWRGFTWLFIAVASLIALSMLLMIVGQGLSQYLIPVLAFALLAQAFAILIVLRSTAEQATIDSPNQASELAPKAHYESELTFTPLFLANPLPTCLCTRDEGCFVGVNDAWVRLFGYSAAEAVGRTGLDLDIWVQPARHAELVSRLNASGSIRDYECQIRAKGGAVRDVLVAAEAIEFNGKRYSLSLIHDITERRQAEEAMQRQTAYLEALHQVTLGIVSELNVDDLLEKALERAVSLIGAAYAWLYLVTPEQDAIELKVATGTLRRFRGTRLKIGEGLSGRIWETGEFVAVENYQAWQGRSGIFEGELIGPAMGMPLRSNGQVIGVIGLTRPATRAPFSEDEKALATRFGNLAEIALKNARLHSSLETELSERARAERALEDRLSFERLITNISTEFINLSTDQIDSGIVHALQAIGEFTGSDRSYVYLFSEDGERMDNLHEWCGAGILSLQSLYRDQPADLLPWTTDQIKQGHVLHVPVFADLPPEARQDQVQMQSHADPPLSYINVPMVYRGRVIGLLGFDAVRAQKTWSADTIALLRIVGEIFVSALERKRADQSLEERRAFEHLITNISTQFINLESDEIDAGIEQGLGAIGQFTGSDRSYVMLFSADGKRVDNTHEWCRAGVESHQARHRNRPVEDFPSVIPQIKQGKVVIIPSFDDYPEAQAERARDLSYASPTQSVVVVPLVYHGKVVGQLGFDSVRARTAWSEDSLALLRIVGEIFVNALEHKRAAEALRRSEMRFRTMFENAGIGIGIMDTDENNLQSNPAICRMLGYSEEEFGRLDSTDYTFPEDYPAQKKLDDEMMAGQRDQYQLEKRYVRKDGAMVWGRLIETVARDTTGKILYLIAMVQDITEQKLAAQKLAEANQTLEQRVSERTRELATLNAIAARVSSSLNLNEIMADALERMMELTGMEHGIAYRIAAGEEGTADTEEAHLRVMAFRGLPPDFADLGDRLPLRQSAAGAAGRRGEPMIWSLAELPSESTLKKRLANQKVEQIIAIPLTAKGRLVGSLNLSTNQSRSYPPEQIALLKTIGQQVGVAVENARLYQQAERSAQAAERSRLARELHDSVTQSLYSMNLYAEATARLLSRGHQEEAIVRLRDLRDTAQEALRAMRLLIFELRPPALDKGLAGALQTRLDTVESRCGVRAGLEVEGKANLSSEMQAELYHIALEALNNALKHARAQSVHIHLVQSPASVHLQIRDDGAGFQTTMGSKRGGFGIAGMRERAQRIGGTLEITSAPGQGTCVTVEVPMGTRETEEQAP